MAADRTVRRQTDARCNASSTVRASTVDADGSRPRIAPLLVLDGDPFATPRLELLPEAKFGLLVAAKLTVLVLG